MAQKFKADTNSDNLSNKHLLLPVTRFDTFAYICLLCLHLHSQSKAADDERRLSDVPAPARIADHEPGP